MPTSYYCNRRIFNLRLDISGILPSLRKHAPIYMGLLHKTSSENMELDELYPVLARQLTHLNAEMDAMECHGVLCARFCVELRPDPAAWVHEVIGSQDANNLQVQASQESLAHLYQHTEQAFHAELENFRLLMPNEDEALSERLQALLDWCGGFVSGLGLGGIKIDDGLDPTVKEILEDFMEMTRMEVDVDDDDENETAFTEIEEYIRVGVMTIGLTMRPGNKSATLH